MAIYDALIVISWLVLVAYWAISAINAKRNISGGWAWRREIGLRLGILALAFLVWRIWGNTHVLRIARPYMVNTNLAAGFVGAGFCVLGAGIAIWARVHLGKNWGMPMSRKANPQLVTSGPYAYVRHPIYSGIILAVLGSAIGNSVLWVIPLILLGSYFVYSAQQEEKLMGALFPDTYSAYVKRTKALIPFIL